jgi:PAS domain S-box-containing protein
MDFADATAWLAAVVQGSQDAIIGKDATGRIRSWNPAAERLFGYRADEIIGQPVARLAPIDRIDELSGILARIQRGERVEPYETVRQRKDGSLVPVSLTVSPVLDASGRIVGASKIARDVSELRRARETHVLLTAELNHRVMNTLANVQSIARQTLRTAGALDRFGSVFEARLLALSRAHSALSVRNWESVAIADLLASMLEPFGGADGSDAQFHLDGEDFVLPPNTFLMLALAVHELATNAAKYGTLSQPGGAIDIHWNTTPVEGGTQVALEWRERGGPPIATPPKRRGFGVRLLERAVAQELAGTSRLIFEPEGAHWAVRFVLGPAAGAFPLVG